MKTVNFIEAVNSGVMFKRVGSGFWYSCDHKNNGAVMKHFGDEKIIVCSDFINSQFELEEKEVTITGSEFDRCFNKYIVSNMLALDFDYNQLKKELGF